MPLGPMLLAVATTSAAANLGPIGPSGQPFIQVPAWEQIEQIRLIHMAELKGLHDDGLAIQRADGGTLSPAHHDELQARLDRIQESYRSQLYRADPFSVDSYGMRCTGHAFRGPHCDGGRAATASR
jgi:hypothetical protein